MELSKQLKQKYILLQRDRSSNLPLSKLKERIITSTEALKLKEVPKHLVIMVVVLLELN
jgi:pyruvate/2-oxoglutarate dehydrogenase complex dihydrolipoamide dehydrogenase (E3) component